MHTGKIKGRKVHLNLNITSDQICNADRSLSGIK